jgi:SpoVK/Ycf46/Vps4 family AAA+-type ATPase
MSQSDSEKYLPWAEEFRDAYARRESAMFVLHNNISDIFPRGGEYLSCRRYLEKMLTGGNFIVINYDVSRGMRFGDDDDGRQFVALANKNRKQGDKLIGSIYDFPHQSTKALAFIEAFIVGIESSERPVAVILEYAEHLAPNGDPQMMTEIDRINSVTLQRFARLFYERLQDSKARDAVCYLLTNNLHNLNPGIVRSEVVHDVEVPRPSKEDRERFIVWQQAKLVVEGHPKLAMDVTQDQLVEQTAGLTLTGIRHLFLRALQSDERRLSSSFIMERKRELIERDSRGMLEILSPSYGMEAVGGNEAIKDFFLRTASDLREGQSDVPVGVICPGPNGVGKTFIAKAFARDSGVNCVSLRNFRGMYVGQTESNLDTIFNILKAMTPNIVIMDEADKMLGNEKSDAGSKVDERVFGAFTAFMGDPDFRGKIFWLLLTARPFNLAPDTGRPGRVEEHVPILAPETMDDKKAILFAIAKASGIELVPDEEDDEISDEKLDDVFNELGFVTPAALALVATRSRRRARREAGLSDVATVNVPFSVFADEAANFVPEGSKTKLRLQTIEAVMYANHLGYLPEPWRSRLRDDPDGLSREREELRGIVGYT